MPTLPASLTPMQFPWTENYGLPAGVFRSKGPTAEACKRFFGRLGYIDWRDYDQHWNVILGDAMAKYKDKHGLPKDPSYGKIAWALMRKQKVPKGRPHAGEFAFDTPARKLVQDEAKVTSDSDEMTLVQYWVRDFWMKAIANAVKWHYDQGRPGDVTVKPEDGGESDCSLMCIQSVRYAQTKSGIIVLDPAKQDFTGFGNTDWYEDDWPKIGPPFRIGDMAHFQNERHVIMCIKEGNVDTAQWGSNGSEIAPELLTLRGYNRYPDEYMFTVRPDLLKAA